MFPALYAILDATPAQPLNSLVSLANKFADAGVQLIQLRAKHLPARHFQEIAAALIAAAPKKRPHHPQRPPRHRQHHQCRRRPRWPRRSPGRSSPQNLSAVPQWVGISTHNLEQLRAANETSADYIAVGPIYPTTTKENPDPVVGLDLIRAARKLTRKPLVAIGGITINSAAEVFQAGADSVAIISDLINAPDPVPTRPRIFGHGSESDLRAQHFLTS